MLGGEFIEPVWRQLRRWMGAAVLVTGVHAGAAAVALTQWPEEEPTEEQQGAIMFELSPLPVAALQTTPDNTPPVEEVKPTEKNEPEPVPDTEIPKVEQSPLAPEPEVALPTPQPETKPEEEKKEPEPDPDPKLEKAEEKKDAVVPVTSDAPSNPAPPAPTTSARTLGTTAKESSQEASWQKSLVTHLGKHRRYPSEARNQRHQGDVEVEFVIDRLGRVVTSSLAKSSGSPLLDQEALAVLQRAAPLPQPPADVAGETFRMTIPIRFRIK